MPNWKATGLDELHRFWLKKFTSLHQAMEKHRDDYIKTGGVPNWMLKSRTILIQKDARKGNGFGNYRPMTSIINENVYDHLSQQKLLSEEQKGCRRKTRGTKDQLLIDKAVVRNSRRRKTNLNMAWIGFRKSDEIVPHSSILKTLELFGTATNIIELLKRSMQSRRTVLFSGKSKIGNVS